MLCGIRRSLPDVLAIDQYDEEAKTDQEVPKGRGLVLTNVSVDRPNTHILTLITCINCFHLQK